MGSLPPLVEPGPELGGDASLRASRQLLLPGLGDIGQRRIIAARVLVIGAGGLGSPVLVALAGAGIGTIGIVDSDTVDVTNLHRQVIHRTADVGELKTASAAAALAALNPQVGVRQHPERLDRHNALGILRDYDLVVDGSDNFATRYLVSDAAALAGIPCVWGSVLRFDGQVTVFWNAAPDCRALDYRDVHPMPPAPGEVLSCDEAGVLGSVCATIGSMMATEVLKLVTGLGEPLLGRILTFDALTTTWRDLHVSRAPGREPVTELIDYDDFCGAKAGGSSGADVATLPLADFEAALLHPGTRLLDVREPAEHALDHLDGDELLPLDDLVRDPATAGGGASADDTSGATGGALIVYCATGRRSARAVEALAAAGVAAVSLEGGIRAWRQRERGLTPAP